MSQPVKLSDALVLDARITAQLAERSIAGQIEFWARLGRAVEPLLSGERSLALRKSGDAQPLSEALATVDSPAGRKRVADFLATQPFPHYEPARDRPGYLVRIEESGKRTIGRFVDREFQPLDQRKRTAEIAKQATKKRPGKRKR
jgi:hypothetical protein